MDRGLLWPDLPMNLQPGYGYFKKLLLNAIPFLSTPQATVDNWYLLTSHAQRDYYASQELAFRASLSYEDMEEQIRKDSIMIGFGISFEVQTRATTTIETTIKSDTNQRDHSEDSKSYLENSVAASFQSTSGVPRYVPVVEETNDEWDEEIKREYSIKGPFPGRFGSFGNVWNFEEATRRALRGNDPNYNAMESPDLDDQDTEAKWFIFPYGLKVQKRNPPPSQMDAFFIRRKLLEFEFETNPEERNREPDSVETQLQLSNQESPTKTPISTTLVVESTTTDSNRANASEETLVQKADGVVVKFRKNTQALFDRCNSALPNVESDEFLKAAHTVRNKGEIRKNRENHDLITQLIVTEIRRLRVRRAADEWQND